MSRGATFIGDVSRQTGLSIHTIRFYESEGLLPEAARTDSGYRVFSPRDIGQLQFIRKAQEIGFSLGEIRELLVLRDRDTDACSHVKSLVEEKLVSVRSKIQALEAMERDLKRVRTECTRQLKRHKRDGTGRCPVLVKLGRRQ
jgi:DNA-binding transcriptional MerR regulator